MPWKKGQSGNPKGGPRLHDLVRKYVGAQELCRPLVPKAVRRIAREMELAEEGSVRLSAAKTVIALAEPEQASSVSISQEDGKGHGVTVVVNFGKKKE